MIPSAMNRRIGQAMHDYSMLDEGDRILLAVSGGVDSLILAWVLNYWQKKAPIEYELLPVHIDMEIWKTGMSAKDPVLEVRERIRQIGMTVHVEKSFPLTGGKRTCYSCSKLRRKQLFDLATRYRCNKIAFGHHRDDLLQTMFLNMFCSGNISTIMPKQELFKGKLVLIRPLAYVEKQEVESLAASLDLHGVANLCPLAGESRREEAGKILQDIYTKIPGAKASFFAAIGNVRREYML